METIFDKKAENIVNAVRATGQGAVPQVATILQDIHVTAIEQVAEMFIQNSSKALLSDPPDHQRANFCQSMAREVRAMKRVKPL